MAKTPGWDAFFMQLSDTYWNALDEESKTHLASEEIPEDIRRAACMIHPHPVGWFSNPIPNYDMKTASELLQRRGGAGKLRAILMEIAPAFLPDSNLFSTQDAEGDAP